MKNKEVERGLFAASGFYLLAAAGLILAMFGSGALGRFLTGLFPNITPEWLTLIVNILYYGLFVFVPVAVWAAKRPDGEQWLRLNPVSLGATIRTVLIALVCVGGAYYLSTLWTILWQELGLNVFVDTYVRPANTAELTRSVLSVGVVAAVSEELLFRGVLLNAWENRSAKQGVLVSALLFAALHGSILGFPTELVCGVVLALIVRWTNSLYAGMIFHSAYNAALVMMNYAFSAGDAGEAEAVRLLDAVGAGGVMQMVFMVLLSAMFAWGLLWKFLIVFRFRRRTSQLLDEELYRRALRRQHRDALYGEADGPEIPIPRPGERNEGEASERAEEDAPVSGEIPLPPFGAASEKPLRIFASEPMTCGEPLSAGIIVLLMAGGLSVLVLYALDLLSMLP